jgi:hypothetical protein
MPLATKSGSLIVKDGKVAENCNCCAPTAGWYCCASRSCLPDNINAITVTISAEDWHEYSAGSATGFHGSANLSPFTLTRMVVSTVNADFGTPPVFGIAQLLNPTIDIAELSLVVGINDCSDSFGWRLAVGWRLASWIGPRADFTRDKLWASGRTAPRSNNSVVTGTSTRGLAPINSSGSASINLAGFDSPIINGNPIATFSVSIT